MRLIDADALINEVDAWGSNDYDKHDFIEAINNAPTLTDRSLEIAQRSVELGRKVGQLEGKLQRPQGEWEKPFEMNGKTYHKCNRCHISSELILIDKFCPNCGARMGDSEK